MIAPTQRRLTLLFTGLILAVAALVFSAVSYYYAFSLRRYLETQLSEEIAENVLAFATKGDLQGVAGVVDTELFQVLDAEGKVFVESSNPLDVDPPVNGRLLRQALAGTAGGELVRLGRTTVLVAYVPLGEGRVARAVAPADVLNALERTIGFMAAVGFPVTLVLSYLAARLLVYRVMIPIRDMVAYQEQFSANISHELLSPLTALKGGMEVALRRERPPGEYRAALGDGLEQVNRIVALLADLQLLATASFRPADLRREPVRLDELLADAVAARQGEAATRGVTLVIAASEALACPLDRALIRRVVENLLENALRYAAPQAGIAIRLRRAGRSAAVQVSNPCAPLSASARARLFEPFSRGPAAQRGTAAGRGLGLHIARHIARSHGGDLALRPGAETQFTIALNLPLGPG
jgi:signal transduction histidine kinase